jgi:GDP-4-dehydro-6-deoxy-D-mannose reductase
VRAFITGITGFDGNYLAKLLLDRGLEVSGISRSERLNPFLPTLDSGVHYRKVNVQDLAGIKDALAEAQPDLIFHLAAVSSASGSISQPLQTYRTNYEGTLNLLDAVRQLNSKCCVLVVSSSLVYGKLHEGERASEPFPLRPETPYAASKVAAEMAAYQYWRSYGIQVVRVRAFNHTGPGQKKGFLCPDLADKLAEIEVGLKPPVLKVREADLSIDFTDVRDIVQGYYEALTNGRPGQVYNLCTGVATTIGMIAKLLVSSARCSVSVQEEPKASAKERRGLVGDPTQASGELGWHPAIPLQRTLADVLGYWRERVRSALAQDGSGNVSLDRGTECCIKQ